ncbi:MAG: Electron transport complex protein RnfC [Candidatus Omnitrophica bacterium ADurb.Bin292]|nr:MAG: Electron transport complex protein RnfC [Candidatus Omnitrophica bacterium ADurb.Bin292]
MPRGIRLERKKESILLNGLKRPFLVKKVFVPMSYKTGSAAVPCVKTGDRVEKGAKIAALDRCEGVSVFSGLAGRVEGVVEKKMPDGSRQSCIAIASEDDFKHPPFRPAEPRKGVDDLSRAELVEMIRDCGIATGYDPGRPASSGLKRASGQALVINGCEPEPYVCAEQALITKHLLEVLKGADILRKAVGAEKVIFVVEDVERELFELVKSKVYFLKWHWFETRSVKAIYPAGQDHFLPCEIPEDSPVFNASTAFAVYEAVFLQKPFFERIVTVGGECVAEPKNLWLPIGTTFQTAIQLCKGLLREPARLIAGGPMCGMAQASADTVITADTSAILALPKEIAGEKTPEPCIRCNRCVDSCPVFLSPAMITLAVENGEFETAAKWGVDECIECGVCSFVCPSHRPMLELIRQVRTERSISR